MLFVNIVICLFTYQLTINFFLPSLSLSLFLSLPPSLSLSLSLFLFLADFLEDYLFLTVGRVGGATSDIQQKVLEIGEYERRDKLIEILSSAGTRVHTILCSILEQLLKFIKNPILIRTISNFLHNMYMYQEKI